MNSSTERFLNNPGRVRRQPCGRRLRLWRVGPTLLALGGLCGAPAWAQPATPLPAAATAAAAAAQPKPRIDKAADLPRFNYPVSGRLDELVGSAERFAPLSAALRRDTESVLSGYEIADKSTQRELISLLAVLDYLDGQYDSALRRAEQVRALQDKPADKLLSGLRLRAMASAARQHAPGSEAFAAALASFIRRELAAAPYAVIANDIKSAKASAELIGEALILGRTRESLQPMADSSGSLSGEFAPGLAFTRLALTGVLPLKATLIKVFADYLAAHQVQKADIWAAREVALAADGAYTSVRLAVWDSGVDTALFKSQLLLQPDGQPTLIAFDKYAQASQGALFPIAAELRSRLPTMVARTKGVSDLQSNIDSAEAGQVKQLLSGLAPEQYKSVVEDFGLAGNYVHGTHVAGITLAGNPFARLVVARIEFNHKLQPDPCPSFELAQRDAANSQTVVDFFKQQQVRVVNMSWGGNVGDIERELEQCQPGLALDARKAQARAIFEVLKNALVKAFASAPQILFVAAAGNSNNDATFTESIPAGIVLPNLLTVGAVDRAGDEAPFTSYGPTVKVHANGYQVESYLPGGARVALSGTSMAAPQVANLAAKLLAAKPQLSPLALVDAITAAADRSADGRRVLMNPKKAMASLN